MFPLIVLSLYINLAITNGLMPEVKVSEGIVQGLTQQTIWGKTIYSFLGIPFAKPPVGDLRFKAPQPVQPWTGIWNASIVPNQCVQGGLGDHLQYAGDEDCLYVNVYIPKAMKVFVELDFYSRAAQFLMG